MPVSKREYISEKTKKAVWGYDFSYRKCRFRMAGYLTKAEAELAEQKARKEVIFDGKVLNPLSFRKFDTFAEDVLSIRADTHSPITVKVEKGHINIINRKLGEKRLDKIDPADIYAYVQSRKADGVGNRTVNIELNLMRVIFTHALQHRHILNNPMIGIKNLKEVVKDRQCLSKEDFVCLVESAKKLPQSEQLATWIQVSAYTGMRPSEVLHLEWKDIEFNHDRIFVRPKKGNPLKTGMFRVVPLHTELKPILMSWLDAWKATKAKHEHQHEWVFFYPADPTQRSQGFRTSFEHAYREAKIVPKSRYEFRHFFISQSVMAGIDLLTVARWVGHSSPQMIYKYYGHLSPSWQGEQMNRLSLLSRPVEAVA